MREALERAGRRPEEVAYINLHGTGTPANDAMESAAISRVFGLDVRCSSSKPQLGHTLGASGATEVALCWMMLDKATPGDGMPVPPHCWDGEADPALPALKLSTPGETTPLKGEFPIVMTNSFGFGGNNCSLLLGRRM